MAITREDHIARLFGAIQPYAWGGYTFLPTFLGHTPEPGKTYAEYWIGAHKKAPSRVLCQDGTTIGLDELLNDQPEKRLGASITQRYGTLPFLLKVMDVREMLSIQVHPTKAEAEKGFARENALGIPLDAPERNYKDENHKPELEVALSDFWLLHGFRPQDQLQAMLTQVPEFYALHPIFAEGGYAGLYRHVMEMPQPTVNALFAPLVERVLQQYHVHTLDASSPDYWVAKATEGKHTEDYDRGLFSIYFLNLIGLKPGQATYQEAGIPHAYLHGQAIEIMANSDNVIRGGLTPKHVDVPELLKLVTCQGELPAIIEGKPGDHTFETVYASPSSDFCLSRIELARENVYTNTARSLEILLMLSGDVALESVDGQLSLKKGESIVIFAGDQYRLSAVSEQAVLFRASIPHGQAID